MSTLTNPRTLNTLRELGCLVDDRVDGKAVAKLLARQLEDGHIAASLDDITAVQMTVGQLASGLIGEEDPEFIDAIRPLLSASAAGKVQQALSNGYMLCSSRISVEISIEGEIVTRSIATRFLSGDPEVIQKYVLDPRMKKVEGVARSTLELTEMVGQRQPEMVDRLTAFTERLNITWQRAIGSGS